ncbi:phosphotransferase [Paenibacillus sp. FSL P4-0338]|uniref:phosphotransferase enzyme family protein n=1 Tax=Paenibacillus sp. FSL P4-0338 TaxID=2921635 RepID=UPI0030FC4ADC
MNHDHLIREINQSYSLRMKQIKLHREMIGSVYLTEGGGKRYVLKIYRSFKTADAMQSIRILDYLQAHSFPAVTVLRTARLKNHILLEAQEGWLTAVLYDYVEGDNPDGFAEAELIGYQTAELHKLMQNYPVEQLIMRTKDEYIDDYLSIMSELDCDSNSMSDLEQYGNELWGRMSKLPRGFCHGDLHTGNIIRNRHGQYVFMDFDDASGDYPGMDVAYMSDATHFNQYHDSMYDATQRLFERFYTGYSKVRTLSDIEIYAIFDFIAVRHYQIISRIVRCQGLQSVTKEFCDVQYGWLMRWQEICMRKRH